MGIRAGACPVDGANAPALASRHLTIHVYHKKSYVHVGSAVPMHKFAVDDDWEYMPEHVPPALAPRLITTMHDIHKVPLRDVGECEIPGVTQVEKGHVGNTGSQSLLLWWKQ